MEKPTYFEVTITVGNHRCMHRNDASLLADGREVDLERDFAALHLFAQRLAMKAGLRPQHQARNDAAHTIAAALARGDEAGADRALDAFLAWPQSEP